MGLLEFVVAALMWLEAADPTGRLMLAGLEHQIVEESPLVVSGAPALATSEPATSTIRVDWDWLSQFPPEVAACVLVHEGVHLSRGAQTEELPWLYEYVCLDRLEAPQEAKDWVYMQLWRGLQSAPNAREGGMGRLGKAPGTE